MLSFRQFITESIRQGLPHIHSMDHKQFGSLIKTGKVHISNSTEKTDGSSFLFGHDENGFYSQSTGSGSEKMRTPTDYHERATRRAKETGNNPNLVAANAFSHVHKILQSNKPLTDHLQSKFKKSGQEQKVRGEVFYKPLSSPTHNPNEVKFVGTSYDTSHMGTVGKIVVHSKLPENKGHDLEHFRNNLSTHEINFDDDKVHHPEAHVAVSQEHKKFSALNHDLLSSRTTNKNRDAKTAELGKFHAIKQKVQDKVDAHVGSLGIAPKWGSGTEGLVVHPSTHNPEAPRFKVTSAAFRDFKSSGVDFRKRS
jgi:hypothetical protein